MFPTRTRDVHVAMDKEVAAFRRQGAYLGILQEESAGCGWLTKGLALYIHIWCHTPVDGLQPVGMEDEFNKSGMPSTTPCVQCGIVGNVRWERVLTGTVIFVEYSCGRCEHVWRVDNDKRLSTPDAAPKERRD